jgi:hypothetical protein
MPLSWICVIIVLAIAALLSARFTYLLARNTTRMMNIISVQHEDAMQMQIRIERMDQRIEQQEQMLLRHETRIMRGERDRDSRPWLDEGGLTDERDRLMRMDFDDPKDPAEQNPTSFERVLKDDPEDPV